MEKRQNMKQTATHRFGPLPAKIYISNKIE